MNFIKLLASAFKRLSTAVTSPFRMMLVRIQRLFNINIITAKLIAPLTKKVKELLGLRPKSKQDYVTIGRFWVFKKLFLLLVLVTCAGVFIYFSMYAPKIPAEPKQQEKVLTETTFDYDDLDISSFSGLANIRSADKKVVYTGQVEKGVCEGPGILFDRSGALRYKGEFSQNMYQGAGVQFYPNGQICYDGEFAANKYNGAGKYYNSWGTLIYEGGFKDGLYDGEGKQYSEDGILIYEGGFSRGKSHGIGVSYNPNGGIHYEGEFYQGQPQGTGALYTKQGKKYYSGAISGGTINYDSLVGANLEEIEQAFLETPKIIYDNRNSCFLFEQAGVIISTDCRVQVDVWENTKEDTEDSSEYYYMPAAAIPAGDPDAPLVISALGELPAETEVTPLAWISSGDGSAQIIPGSQSSSGSSGSEPQQGSGSQSTPTEDAPQIQTVPSEPSQIIVNLPEPKEEPVPDFIEKNITLYFEIDKNVWKTEAELDKSKVFVRKVTVIDPAESVRRPEADLYDENLPPSIEDCVAIDLVRQTRPTVFSNIRFEMDKQNKTFIHLKNISYAERIVQKACVEEGLTYRYSYPLDQKDQLMYYSIEK